VAVGSLNPGAAFTASAWVKLPAAAATTDQEIIATDVLPGGWQLLLMNRKPLFNVAGGVALQGSAPDVADGQWHHVAAVLAAGAESLYVDGVLVAQSAIAAVTPQSLPTAIGQRPDGYGAFDGWIDEVAVFSAALTPDAV